MKKLNRTLTHLNPALAGLLLAALFLGLSARPAAAETAPAWQDTGIPFSLQDTGNHFCFDALQPDKLLMSTYQYDQPTYSLDLKTGQKAQLNALSFYDCNEATGQLYAEPTPGSKDGIRFSSADPAGKQLTYYPNAQASDGSLWVYSTQFKSGNSGPMDFYASPDGGTTWQKRELGNLNGDIQSMTVAASDGRVIYLMTGDSPAPNRRYTVYGSNDAGVTWEKRSEFTYQDTGSVYTPSLYFGAQPGRTAPANYLTIVRSAGAGSNGSSTIMLSTDGGRTFIDVGANGRAGWYDLVYSDNSLVRLHQGDTGRDLASSVDGGKTWQSLKLPIGTEPYNPNTGYSPLKLTQAKNAPNNLFLSYANGLDGEIWHSPDGGKTWHDLGLNMINLLISPYAPTYMLGFKDNKIYRLELSSLTDKTETNGVALNNGLDGTYFEATRHNLSGLFKKYWTDHGGLAQFGFPWTEPFREYNPADGKIYIVQYFERNRFEYHPENAGTPYEVLLGLLGNQQTEPLRAAGHGAFNHFDNMHYPGGTYFPQTGHNLRNSFKDYWEANGGLAIYGYPISEEYEEVNPDDGKTYVVQYFERNRFEYHPENKGTKYEVLLGLLGNSLLKSKGWL